MGRNEKQHRRSRRQGFAPAAPERAYENTGVFSGVGRPSVVGVSDEVKVATRNLARRASKAARRWDGTPQTESAIHSRIARMEARRASEEAK